MRTESTPDGKPGPEGASPSGLSVDGVSLSIGGVKILDDISIDVESGTTLGLIGANGSGKSSLLNVVSGYYRPQAGRIALDGRELPSRPATVARQGVGRSFQHVDKMAELSVREFVALGSEPHWTTWSVASLLGLPVALKSEADAFSAADELISEFGLADFSTVAMRNAPYGVRKIADILRAVGSKPRLLLLDEPTSGVSADDRAIVRDVILQWAEAKACAIVVVDHDIRFVLELTSRLAALSAGKLLAWGNAQDVLAEDIVIQTFVGKRRHM